MVSRGFLAGAILVALAVVVSTLGVLPGVQAHGPGAPELASIPSSTRAAIAQTPDLARLPPPTAPASAGPPPAGAYYLQEGMNFIAENGSVSSLSTVLSETFPLVSSPYSMPGSSLTAYELNGVTSAGDWIQMAVGDNWPTEPTGCSLPTFDLFYELWNNTGTSVAGPAWVGATSCSQGFTPVPGDVIGLSMSLNCASGGVGTVCLTFSDVTQGVNTTAIEDQPDYYEHDVSASTFLNWPDSFASANGYYVGPATEVVQEAKSCPSFVLPPVLYTLDSPNGVTAYDAWSDEWAPASDYICSALTGTTGVVAVSPVTTFVQAAAKTALGDHWLAVQNWSTASAELLGVNASGEVRFETDPVAWAFSVDVMPPVVDVGEAYAVQGIVWGGAPSGVSCQWSVGGVPLSPRGSPCSWTGNASTPGPETIEGSAADSVLNVENGSSVLSVDGVLNVALASSVSSVAQDQPVTFTATVTGGVAPYTYAWSGLPASCPWYAYSTVVSCVPTVAGAYAPSVTVTDARGAEATSAALAFPVTNPCVAGDCYPVTFTAGANAPRGWAAGLFVYCAACHTEEPVVPANGSHFPTYEYTVPNGTYAYLWVGGAGERVAGAVPFGNLTVDGAGVQTVVQFTAGSTSTVTFSRAGVPAGTSWCVSLGWTSCTTAATISVRGLTHGTYPYAVEPLDGYAATVRVAGQAAPSYGWVTLAKAATPIAAKLTQETYPLTFSESGLANDRGWTVKLSGRVNGRPETVSRSSRGASIVFDVPNGTFTYTVKPVTGYTGNGSGTVVVPGGPTGVAVTFVPTGGGSAGARDGAAALWESVLGWPAGVAASPATARRARGAGRPS